MTFSSGLILNFVYKWQYILDSFKYSDSVAWTQNKKQFRNCSCSRHKFINLRYLAYSEVLRTHTPSNFCIFHILNLLRPKWFQKLKNDWVGNRQRKKKVWNLSVLSFSFVSRYTSANVPRVSEVLQSRIWDRDTSFVRRRCNYLFSFGLIHGRNRGCLVFMPYTGSSFWAMSSLFMRRITKNTIWTRYWLIPNPTTIPPMSPP